MLTPIRPPAHVTTVEVFLRPEDLPPPARRGSLGKRAKPAESALSWCSWVRHLNRLVTRNGIVFAGEEPIRYAHFYDLLTGLRRDLPIEICTRLGFDVSEWLARVSPDRFDAARLTPTLRVRFDPRTMDAETTIERALLLQGAGFQIGLRAVHHRALRRRPRRSALRPVPVPQRVPGPLGGTEPGAPARALPVEATDRLTEREPLRLPSRSHRRRPGDGAAERRTAAAGGCVSSVRSVRLVRPAGRGRGAGARPCRRFRSEQKARSQGCVGGTGTPTPARGAGRPEPLRAAPRWDHPAPSPFGPRLTAEGPTRRVRQWMVDGG